MPLPYKKGSSGPEIRAWQDWAYDYAASYAGVIGGRDAYYGNGEDAFTRELQRRLGIPQTGEFDAYTASKVPFKIGGKPVTAPTRRKIWWYSNPGSGANEFIGPSFNVGERVSNVLHISHQPVHSAIGGYLGLMGGDPTFSYVDVTYDQYQSQLWLLDNNPDVQEAMAARAVDPNAKVDVELWFSGYSQKADGLEDALEILFGDGGFVIPKTGEVCGPGKYRILRDRINGVVQFGNPSTKGTGIARKIRPDWLYALVHNINKVNDFYAVATDPIRPAFYAIIIKADMELPFFVHVLRIAVPVIMSYIPILGLFGPLGQVAVAGISGLNAGSQLLGSMFGQAASEADAAVDKTLENMLSPTGILQDIPGLIQLVGALPGLQAHGMYDANDEQRAYDVVASFRR